MSGLSETRHSPFHQRPAQFIKYLAGEGGLRDVDRDNGTGIRKKYHRDGLDLDVSGVADAPRMEDIASPREA